MIARLPLGYLNLLYHQGGNGFADFFIVRNLFWKILVRRSEKMKKIRILIVSVALAMMFNTGAFAAPEENTTVPTEEEVIEAIDQEVTEEDIKEADETTLSDKFIYNFERLVDSLKVAITFDEEKELQLLKEIAEKRLLDSETLLEEDKFTLSEEVLLDFESIIFLKNSSNLSFSLDLSVKSLIQVSLLLT